MKLKKITSVCAEMEDGTRVLVGRHHLGQRGPESEKHLAEIIHRVELHDELVEALRAALPPLKAFRAMADEGSRTDEACKKLEDVLAKVEGKGK